MQPMSGRKSSRARIAAIHANRGVEAWYRDKLQALLARCNASLLVHVAAAWKQAPPLTGFAGDAPTSSVLLQRALAKWGGLWVRKFNRLSLDLSRTFARKSFGITEAAMRAKLKDAGFTVEFKPTPHSVETYHAVVAENVGLIKSIPQQYLDDVKGAVWRSVMQGADLDELSRGIRESYGVSHRRAALIARDQNNKAKAVIENTRRVELGIVEAIWQHSHGGKQPRPTHVRMDGKRFKISAGMYDSDEGRSVWPGELINCRCTSSAIIPGIDD